MRAAASASGSPRTACCHRGELQCHASRGPHGIKRAANRLLITARNRSRRCARRRSALHSLNSPVQPCHQFHACRAPYAARAHASPITAAKPGDMARRPRAVLRAALCAAAAAAAAGRKRGHDAFWIMDPSDQLCLTTHGTLGPCDGDAMWVYVPRKGKDKWSLASVLEPCLLYTSPSPRDGLLSRMPSSA